jgi:hypothetical protein
VEEFLKGYSSSLVGERSNSPEPRPKRPESPTPKAEEPVEDMNNIKSLPNPGDDTKEEFGKPNFPKQEKKDDLIHIQVRQLFLLKSKKTKLH